MIPLPEGWTLLSETSLTGGWVRGEYTLPDGSYAELHFHDSWFRFEAGQAVVG